MEFCSPEVTNKLLRRPLPDSHDTMPHARKHVKCLSRARVPAGCGVVFVVVTFAGGRILVILVVTVYAQTGMTSQSAHTSLQEASIGEP